MFDPKTSVPQTSHLRIFHPTGPILEFPNGHWIVFDRAVPPLGIDLGSCTANTATRAPRVGQTK